MACLFNFKSLPINSNDRTIILPPSPLQLPLTHPHSPYQIRKQLPLIPRRITRIQ